MVCELAETAAEALWPSLLELRRFLQTDEALTREQVAFVHRSAGWSLVVDPGEVVRVRTGSSAHLMVPLDETDDVPRDQTLSAFSELAFRTGEAPFSDRARILEPGVRSIFRIYLPMLLGGYRARKRGELFVTAHVAQTLDGRIACLNGHSQWISNRANLFHAHRIRALHDGVMVGRGTVEKDDPALTVRHVAGVDPRRIVLNSSASLLHEECAQHQVLRDAGCLLMVSREGLESERTSQLADLPATVEVVGVDTGGEPTLSPAQLGEAFHSRGIHSIFLEGGSTTLSRYFDLVAIDLLHVHFAPVILGSGISSFSLPEVETVQLAHRMTTAHFVLDGELLIECRGQRSNADSAAPLSGGGH